MALWHISNDIYVIPRVGINDYELIIVWVSAFKIQLHYVAYTLYAAILRIKTSSRRRFSFFKVTVSLTFVFASIAGELYFVLMNNRRFLSGRWTEGYVASSLAINVVLALLLESLVR